MIFKYSLVILLFSSAALAENFSDRLYNRQLVKQKERFSIVDALFSRPKVKLKDQFFSSNKNTSWFENILSAGQGNDGMIKAQYQGAVFVKFLGFEGWQSENVVGFERTLGINIRVLGSSQQNTRFNVLYGKYQTDEEELQMVGAEMGLYIFNQIGVSHRFESLLGSEMQLSRTFSEVFFEYGAFRLFGRWVEGPSKGGTAGLTFFF